MAQLSEAAGPALITPFTRGLEAQAYVLPAESLEHVIEDGDSAAVELDDSEPETDHECEECHGEDEVQNGTELSTNSLVASLEELNPYDLSQIQSAVAELHSQPLADWLTTLEDPDGDQLRIALAIAHLDAAKAMPEDAAGSIFELGWYTSEPVKATQAIAWVTDVARSMFGTEACDCGDGCEECGNLAVIGHRLARRSQ